MTPRPEPTREIDFTRVRVEARQRVDRPRKLVVWTPCPSRGIDCGSETCARCPLDRGLSFDPIDSAWYRLCWRASTAPPRDPG